MSLLSTGMTSRRATILTAAVALGVFGLALTGCAPTAPSPSAPVPGASAPAASTPSGSPSPVTSTPPAPQPTPSTVALPADALLHVTATATASTGAVMNVDVVVRKARLWNTASGSPRATATAKRCGEGEVDLATIKSGKWMFAEADYTLTLADSSSPWPTDLHILLAPYGNAGASRTAAGDAYQKEFTLGGPGDYEPMCAQRAFMKGPGASGASKGALYLGAPGTDELKGWASEVYGFDFSLPTKKADPSKVTVSDCVGTITPLGKTLGAPNRAWVTTSSGTKCLVGDPETQNAPHN